MSAWRLLADENVESEVVESLRRAGHDVRSVSDSKSRFSDDAILQAALRQRRVLVTNDKDFAELMFLQGRPSRGIILLRMPRLSSTSKAKRLIADLESRSSELGRAMLVIEEAAARVRTFHAKKPGSRRKS